MADNSAGLFATLINFDQLLPDQQFTLFVKNFLPYQPYIFSIPGFVFAGCVYSTILLSTSSVIFTHSKVPAGVVTASKASTFGNADERQAGNAVHTGKC
ncbi:MAG: hypothetical protein H6559_18865 [Lewinellaceae bacterium]|nr:hypothetical protein [Lewinellaceae bacterium]